MTIDLHGFNVEQTLSELSLAIFSFQHDEYEQQLEIITGKGQKVVLLTTLDYLDEEGIYYHLDDRRHRVIIYKHENPQLEDVELI